MAKQPIKEEEKTKKYHKTRAQLLACQVATAFLLRAVVKATGTTDPELLGKGKENIGFWCVLNEEQFIRFRDITTIPDLGDTIHQFLRDIYIRYEPSKQVTCIDESRPDELPSPEELR